MKRTVHLPICKVQLKVPWTTTEAAMVGPKTLAIRPSSAMQWHQVGQKFAAEDVGRWSWLSLQIWGIRIWSLQLFQLMTHKFQSSIASLVHWLRLPYPFPKFSHSTNLEDISPKIPPLAAPERSWAIRWSQRCFEDDGLRQTWKPWAIFTVRLAADGHSRPPITTISF